MEQALLVLANAIGQAWLRGKVVTLDARFQERGTPLQAGDGFAA